MNSNLKFEYKNSKGNLACEYIPHRPLHKIIASTAFSSATFSINQMDHSTYSISPSFKAKLAMTKQTFLINHEILFLVFSTDAHFLTLIFNFIVFVIQPDIHSKMEFEGGLRMRGLGLIACASSVSVLKHVTRYDPVEFVV